MHALRTAAAALRGPIVPRATRVRPLSHGWCLRWRLAARPFGPGGLTHDECLSVAFSFQSRVRDRQLDGHVQIGSPKPLAARTPPDVVLNLNGDLPDEDTQRLLTHDLREILTDLYVSRP